MTTRPRAHEMGVDQRYFDLIATGRKTTEIRVNDSSRARLTIGSLIRFRCGNDEVLTRVTSLNRYPRLRHHEAYSGVADRCGIGVST